MHAGQALLLTLALFYALAAALVGCVALMKRMLLAGDVISHLALPGLGAALAVGVNPLIGGAATLFLGTLLIWRLENKTGLTIEAAVGVIFAGALAIGAAVTPREDLAESLFGELPHVSLLALLLGMVAALSVVLSVYLLRERLVLSIFSPDLAVATGVNVARVDLSFLLLFSLTVLIGLRFMGALLASGLIIMPAATARQWTDRMAYFLLGSLAVSMLSVIGGFAVNAYLLSSFTVGPAIVIVSALLFGLTLLGKAMARA
jgi:ABC-type Mn2+/Zn2+ transport system permease subunit